MPDVGKLLRTSTKLTKAAQRQSAAMSRQTKVALRQTQTALRQSAAISRQTSAALGMSTAMRAGRKGGRFVEVDGIRVHYIARGRGRPVVLLHGNGTMAQDFAVCGLIDQLAERYRVIAIDRPGFGHTIRPRHRVWTPTAQAHVVDRVMDRLNVRQPVIVAHSWGTLVALALAVGGSPDLRGLVLLSGYFFRENRADLALSAPLAIPGLGDVARALVPPPLNKLVAQQAFRHAFSPQPVPMRFRTRFPVGIAMGRDQLRASAEDTAIMNAATTQLRPHYATLRLPVAILAGDADAVVDTNAQSVRLHSQIPGSTLQIMPGQGHMIQYSAKRQIGRAIDRLMNDARDIARAPIREVRWTPEVAGTPTCRPV